jgi:thiamine-phosphate pyrophosphorylase
LLIASRLSGATAVGVLRVRHSISLEETVTAARPTTQLYATLTPGAAARERISAVLDVRAVTSILIRAVPGTRLGAGEVKPLVEMIQGKGVAALIDGDAQLARTVRADGVHINRSNSILDAYRDARGTLGERFIIGVDAGHSRHDAMTLGEAGADYVAFSTAPSTPAADDEPIESRNDLIGWWAEIFEVPCVAFDVATPDEATLLAQLGADFVAVSIAPGVAPAAAKDFVASIAAAVTVVTA